jgi:hypothetical protein
MPAGLPIKIREEIDVDIRESLNKLSDYQAQRQVVALVKQEQVDRVNLAKQASIDEFLTPEIKTEIAAIEIDAAAQLADIDAEFSDKLTALEPNIAALTDEIKAAVIENGASVKGDYLQAVYTSPRVTWDGKGIAGYAVAHPEINAFKKVGEASVSFRDVK